MSAVSGMASLALDAARGAAQMFTGDAGDEAKADTEGDGATAPDAGTPKPADGAADGSADGSADGAGLPAASDEPEKDAFDYIMELRQACLVRLPKFKMLRTQTLLELKMQLLTMPSLAFIRSQAEQLRPVDHAASGLAADGATPLVPSLADLGVTPGQLRIMELTSNYVPGKVLRGSTTKLQRFGGNKAYVVEVLPHEEDLPQNCRLLYVQTRVPNIRAQRKAFAAVPVPPPAGADGKPSNKEPKLVPPSLEDFAISTSGAELSSKVGFNTPTWPPLRAVFEFKKRADTNQLRQCLAGVTGIPVARVKMAKLFVQKNKVGAGMWRVVSDSKHVPKRRRRGRVGAHTFRCRTGWSHVPHALLPAACACACACACGLCLWFCVQGNHQSPPNLLEAPFLLKDGDLISVVDKQDDPDGEDNWLRPEDYRTIARKEIMAQIKREARHLSRTGGGGGDSNSGGNSRVKAAARREVRVRAAVVTWLLLR